MTPFLKDNLHRLKPDPNTGCLVWLGATAGSKGKRPQVKLYGKKQYVARIVCEEAHGPQPDGHEVCHNKNCMNGMCVNDEHIRWGTHEQNIADGVR